MKFRMAIIQGGDGGQLGQVAQADSITNRLTALLRYLSSRQSDQGWNQFLDSRKEIDWSKIAISGQSQGGGHAYVISKYNKVARVLMFGSPKDYSFYFRQPAEGFDDRTRTPLDRYFAFNHMEDNAHGCNHNQQSEIFQKIGLNRLGSVEVDQPNTNFNHAHLIYTDLAPAVAGGYHGCVISGGVPVCVPVWQYMLTEPVQ